MKHFVWLLILICLNGVGAAIALGHDGHAPLPTRGASIDPKTGVLQLSREAREILDLKTAEVIKRPIASRWFAYATIQSPWNSSAFVGPLLGGRIVTLHVQPGESVHPGQLLAELDSQELQQLRTEVLTAKNSFDLATETATRLETATKAGAVPAQQLLEAQNQAAQADNALAVARRKWLALDLPADRLESLLAGKDSQPLLLPIRAPIDGIANHADLSVGKIVDPQEHVFEIADLKTLWLRIQILEKDLSRVELGQPLSFTLTSHPGEPFTSTIDKLGRALDPTTHVGDAWATLSNPPGGTRRFMPGMTAQVHLGEADQTEKLAVPLSAVLRDGADRFVLVERASSSKGSEFKKETLVLGRQGQEFVEVRGGRLFPSDRVVTQGSHELAGFFVKGSLTISDETATDIGLKVSPVATKSIEEVMEVDGTIDVPTDRRALASSPIDGVIERILIDRAQQVREGDVIAEIRSLEFQNLQLELLRATLDQRLQESIRDKLRASGESVAKRRLLDVEAAEREAAFRIDGAQQRLATIGLTEAEVSAIRERGEFLPTLPLRAAIDGTVIAFQKVLGQVVRPEEPLFEIHDLSRSFVEAFVPEKDAGRVSVGQTARIRLVSDSATVLTGRVIRSGHTIGAQSRSLSVWIEVDGDGMQMHPHNSLARVTFSGSRYSAVAAVPVTALMQEGSRSFVFVKGAEGRFQRRAVSVGRKDDRFAEILTGLSSNDEVAFRGVSQLQTGFAAIR